ncbi:MAG: PIG-L family deacetylase [Gemmatimonadota bacterium]|nr:PIG-L family deacetylase [Gemmatimonadota bacterium]
MICVDAQRETVASALRPGAMIVIVAPHPDDESLAAGGLIQRARARGARVAVVFMTDGDMNPWPQRAAETRAVIGRSDRVRWGRRRRAEAHAALTVLGVHADAVHVLGMADMGLTEALARDPAGASVPVATLLHELAPDLVVLPSLYDTHPDHSAAHVMWMLALHRAACDAGVATYAVHGRDDSTASEFEISASELATKMRAVGEHASQLVLSRRRMLAYAKRPERFAVGRVEQAGARPDAPALLRWRAGSVMAQLCRLLIVTGDAAWRVPIGEASAGPVTADAPRCVRVPARRLSVIMPRGIVAGAPVFAKLYARVSMPWIYDRWGWERIS